jgi:hypothetical protein
MAPRPAGTFVSAGLDATPIVDLPPAYYIASVCTERHATRAGGEVEGAARNRAADQNGPSAVCDGQRLFQTVIP